MFQEIKIEYRRNFWKYTDFGVYKWYKFLEGKESSLHIHRGKKRVIHSRLQMLVFNFINWTYICNYVISFFSNLSHRKNMSDLILYLFKNEVLHHILLCKL